MLGVGIGTAEDVNVTLAGNYDTARNAYDVAVSGNYAYVTDLGNGLVLMTIVLNIASIADSPIRNGGGI